MNWESIISLLCSFGIVLIGQRVLLLDRRGLLHNSFFLLTIILAALCFGWYNMSQSTSLELAMESRRIIGLWPLAIYLVMVCTFLYAHPEHRLLSRPVVLGFGVCWAGLALLFTGIDMFTPDFHGGLSLSESGHWLFNLQDPKILDWCRGAWLAITLGASGYFTYWKYQKDRHEDHRFQVSLAFYSVSICLAVVFLHMWLIPMMGFPIFHNVSLEAFLGILFFAWAFTDFKLFEVRAEKAMGSVMDSMTNLLIITNNRYEIKKVNAATEKLFNIKESDILHKTIDQLLLELNLEKWNMLKEGHMAFDPTRREKQFEMEVVVDEKKYFLLFLMSPFYNELKKQTGYTVIGIDLTAYKVAEQKIKEYTSELEKSNEALEQFAYIASHDLKEPVRTAGSFVSLLKRRMANIIDENCREYLAFIEESIYRMQQLIDSTLLVSKYQDMSVNLTKIEPQKILNRIESNLDTIIKEKSAKIFYTNMPTVMADQMHLELLLQNLVENGLKYNESDQPEVVISCDQKDAYYEFSVMDNGIGISPEYKHQIFQMFKRLHNRSRYQGTGIGLAICKRIIEKHKGTIWVESQEGEGAAFKFTLPMTEQN